MKLTVASIILLSGIAAAAFAQPPSDGGDMPPPPSGDSSGQRGMRPMGPPPEAYDACSGSVAGASCRFSDRSGRTRSGICSAAPAFSGPGETASGGNALACGMNGK